jgi:hypothetical protein
MADFEHHASFSAAEVSGRLELDAFESYYRRLFEDMLRDGVIEPWERRRLGEVAGSLELRPERLQEVERAVSGVYEARYGRPVRELSGAETGARSAVDQDDDDESHCFGDLPLSAHAPASGAPRPAPALRTAPAPAATAPAAAPVPASPRPLPEPRHALGETEWGTLLRHADEDPLVGEIFALVAPAVMLGHVSARRRAGQIDALDPWRWLDTHATELPIVQAFQWAARTLSAAAPPLYGDPDLEILWKPLASMPTAVRLGAAALAEREPRALAFLAGRCLALLRRERFMCLLTRRVGDLERLFLAALRTARPELPLADAVRARVDALAVALRRFLDPALGARLAAAVDGFVERGGRASLGAWARAADCTAARAGFLLSENAAVAERMLALEGSTARATLLEDLAAFAASPEHRELRRRLGLG